MPLPDTFIDPDDRPLPPPDNPGAGPLRWVVTGVAAVLLIVGAWRAYQWLDTDVQRRRALASGAAVPEARPHAAGSVQDVPPPPDADTGRPVEPPPPATQPAAEGAPGSAPAGVHRCVIGGQITYTNTACPPESEPAPPATAAPAATPALSDADADSPDARTAICRHLAAEAQRLDFEFQQPLPPPVIDHIATRQGELRAQQESVGCRIAAPKRKRGGDDKDPPAEAD